jgi:broad specificity phosphatase PhoE
MSASTIATAEIILVRHGRSAHVERAWLDAEGVRRWMRAYDAAGIAPEPPPSPTLVALAQTADLILTSDLPRAVESGRVLARSREIEPTPLLREAPLECPASPLPALGGARLPLGAWALVFGMRWLRARMRGAPPPGVDDATLARADEAAAWLAERAGQPGRVIVVTHGTMRTLIAAALVRRGWQRSGPRPFREWSAWHLRATDAQKNL